MLVSPAKVHLKSELVGSRHELLLLPPPPPPTTSAVFVQGAEAKGRREALVVCTFSLHMGDVRS